MGDARRDFGEFYPGGGAAQPVEADVEVGEALDALDARLDALKGRLDAAAAVTVPDADGAEGLAEVKETVGEVVAALAE
jgi:hypothetical protein